jgi:DNA-binding NtrC family response regulator
MDELQTRTKNAETMGETTNEPKANREQAANAPGLTSPNSPPLVGLRRFRAEAEIHAIGRALEQTGWNRRRAAQLLSISYRGLLYKIRQHSITAATASQLTGLTEDAKAK